MSTVSKAGSLIELWVWFTLEILTENWVCGNRCCPSLLTGRYYQIHQMMRNELVYIEEKKRGGLNKSQQSMLIWLGMWAWQMHREKDEALREIILIVIEKGDKLSKTEWERERSARLWFFELQENETVRWLERCRAVRVIFIRTMILSMTSQKKYTEWVHIYTQTLSKASIGRTAHLLLLIKEVVWNFGECPYLLLVYPFCIFTIQM